MRARTSPFRLVGGALPCSLTAAGGLLPEVARAAESGLALPGLEFGGLGWAIGGLIAGALLSRLLWRPAPCPPENETTLLVMGEDIPPHEDWQLYAEMAGDWWWATDAGLRFIETPHPPPAVLGLGGLAGRMWTEVVPPDEREAFMDSLQDTLTRQVPLSVTLTRPDRDGRVRHLSLRGLPRFDDEGQFLGYRGIGRDVTEQAALAADLQRTEARLEGLSSTVATEIDGRRRLRRDATLFRRLFELAPCGIALVNAEGRPIQFNVAFAALLGRTAGALADLAMDSLMEGDAANQWRDRLARSLGGDDGEHQRDVEYLREDGQRIPLLETLVRLDGIDGLPTCALLTLEERHVQPPPAVVPASEPDHFRTVFEDAPEAILVSVGGQIRMANAASRRLLGGTQRLEGQAFLNLVMPDDRGLEAQRLEQFAASTSERLLPPLPLRFGMPGTAPVQAEATAVRSVLGGQPALIHVLRDVSRWLQVEQSLRESQAMYRDAVESVREILFQTDAQGRLSFLNRAWRQISGFDARLSIGQNLLDFVDEQDRGLVTPHLRSICEGYEEIAEIEFRLRTQPGSLRWMEATLRPLRDTCDRVVGCAGALADVTARKEAEQTQRNLNRELEARVRARTAELETSNRELEAFSYSVSHDLRAPLRAIDGFAQIVAEDYAPRLDDIGKEYLQRIRVATQRMARLIDDLIELARLTRQTMKREPVNLSLLVEQILGELQQEQPARQVSIQVEPNLVAAADRALMRVALDNLLRNAWKFTSRRELAEIRFHAELRDQQMVYCVSDNGAGFDMNFASKLFLPFHRLHGISEFAGTGIGLATVLRVIQRHDGRVWAESSPDAGANFYFTLGR